MSATLEGMSRAIASLADADATRLDRFGAKGARLAMLLQAGFPVPPGFVVACHALTPIVDSACAKAAVGEQGESELITSVLTSPFPAPLLQQLGECLTVLGVVAVRSSSLFEDGARQSGAGQFLTVLGIDDLVGLEDACKRVLASQFTDHARRYWMHVGGRGANNMAVLILRMLSPEASGVIFTRDPRPGMSDDTMLIEACAGLGTSVVDGTGIAERVFVRPRTMETVTRQLKTQMLKATYDPTSHTVVKTQGPFEAKPVLSEDDLIALVELARAIEDHFGSPQDIEWAIENEAVFILQSRPITSLKGTAQ